jgi:hypothetical protein
MSTRSRSVPPSDGHRRPGRRSGRALPLPHGGGVRGYGRPDAWVRRAAVVSTDPDLAPAFCRRGIPALIGPPSTPQSDLHPCGRRCRRPRVASKPRAADASTPPGRCREGSRTRRQHRWRAYESVGSSGSRSRCSSTTADHLTFMLAMRRAMRRFGSTPSRSSTAASLAQMRFGLASCAHIRRGDSARRLPSRSLDRFS